MSEYEVLQRMMGVAPANEASAERWAHYMLERMARAGLVVRVKASEQ